nr:cadherin-like beta sandwich domain-containing protein [Akkermansiaceae bacterium]
RHTPATPVGAAGNEVTFALNFAPPAGTALTVVNHTGTDAIHGTFENLGQWQAVELSHDGVVYRFVANYFGGTGNDLVLEWAHTRPLAWGGATFNFGQLGNGSITNSSIAVPVDMSGVLAGKTVVRTATGSGHSVALCADGALAAWGENSTHALGNTGTANSSVPVMVDWSGIPAGKTVVAITAGARHNLALCADGSVVAWGSNSSGQLGGSGTAASWSLPILVDQTGVLAGRTVIAVAAGGTHNLALCTDGTLAAWGSNSYGQLGTNSTTNSPVPVLVNTSGVLAGKTVTAIAAGNSHSMALCSDGTLAVWGYNASGQLGNNSVTNSAVPVLVQQTGVLAGKPLAAIAAGYAHCLVLCADGTLAAWGENASGQLGNGGTTSSKVPVLVNQTGVLAGKTVATISAGSSCSLAQCADGTVATWGGNSSGSLGNNSTTGSTVPVAVTTTMLRTGERFARAETGHNSSHSLAIVAMPPPPVGLTLAATDIIDTGATLNASVNAQGTSATVAFEYGLTTSYGATVAAIPGSASGTAATVASARLSGLPAGTTYHYRVVATGTSGTAKGEDMTFTTTTAASLTGLTPSAGTLFPALASDTVNYVAAVPHATASITLTPVCPNGDAVVTINGAAVASGTASGPLALAVGNNVINTVVAAGGGTNTQTYVLTVTRLPATFTYDTATDTPVTVDDFLAAGHTADFALNFTPAPGTILSVVKNTGMNPIQGAFTNLAQGQIVNLTRDGVSYPFVANYFGGTGNDLVLQWGSNRSLAWGENTYGTLGTNSQYGSSSPVPVRSNDASAGKVIIANATGNHYRLALCADGALLAWGRNDFGQLGNNGNQHSFEAVLVDRTGVLAGKTVIAVAAGTSHSLALCADGTLAAWGSNYSGQLGNRGADNASVPVRVDQTGVLAGRKIVAIAAGTGTSFALCADGRVAAWGDNTNGRLGNGSTLHSSVPVWVDHSGALAGKSVVA